MSLVNLTSKPDNQISSLFNVHEFHPEMFSVETQICVDENLICSAKLQWCSEIPSYITWVSRASPRKWKLKLLHESIYLWTARYSSRIQVLKPDQLDRPGSTIHCPRARGESYWNIRSGYRFHQKTKDQHATYMTINQIGTRLAGAHNSQLPKPEIQHVLSEKFIMHSVTC